MEQYSKPKGFWVDFKSQLPGRMAALRKSRLFMIGLLLSLLVTIALIIFFNSSPGPQTTIEVPDSAYFYDLGTGKLFSGPLNEIGPIEPPSKSSLPSGQPAGVRAMVYSCGSCDGERFIGYLYLWPPEERAKPANRRLEHNSVVAAVEKQGEPALQVTWFARTDEAAEPILNFAQKKCGSRAVVVCAPSYKRIAR